MGVEVMAKKFIVIVDESKLVDGLGISGAMPVEITPFCHEHTMRQILALPSIAGCTGEFRKEGDALYVTDNGNYIVDLFFKDPIRNAKCSWCSRAWSLFGYVNCSNHCRRRRY